MGKLQNAINLQSVWKKSIIDDVKTKTSGGVRAKTAYKRVLLKVSGEVLGDRARGECLAPEKLAYVAGCVKRLRSMGVQTGIVTGGGNIFRGLAGSGRGFDRTTGDSMGMLATAINSLAIANALESAGIPAKVFSAVEMPKIAETFTKRKAVECLEKGIVAVFAGGTGNPFFSTDSAAALKACEIGAEVLLKATKVNGIYTADPAKDPSASKYDALGFSEALEKRLGVMDAAAFALCMDNDLPIIVFDFSDAKALEKAVRGEKAGTIVGRKTWKR